MTKTILALDTSTENCSVALLVDNPNSGRTYFTRSEIAPRDHTKKILPMVDEVLKEAGISLDEVDALAFGQGPGSFTGVRIGIGIAQGLAFGADLPMIGISTLAAMAQGSYRMNSYERVAAAIDARMSEIYWGRYIRQSDGDWLAHDEECVIPPAELVETLPVETKDEKWARSGTGWAAYEEELSGLALSLEPCSVLYPEAQDIAHLAMYALKRGQTVPAEESSPVYLRDKVAWKKLPGRE